MPTGDEEADIETLVAPEAEDDAAASAPESPESLPSGEEDWVKVAEVAPEIVDAAIEPAPVIPATDDAAELVQTFVAGECGANVSCCGCLATLGWYDIFHHSHSHSFNTRAA